MCATLSTFSLPPEQSAHRLDISPRLQNTRAPPVPRARPTTGMAPPPDPPDAPGGSRADAVCGNKFRAMLRCVERSGAAAACTDKVNDFLACERHVFQQAMRKSSKQPSPASAPAPPASRAPPAQHKPHPRAAQIDDAEDKGPTSFFTHPLQSLQRVVKKQAAACVSLAEVMRKPAYHTQLFQFNQRMLADIKVTCEIIRAKTVHFVDVVMGVSDKGNGKP